MEARKLDAIDELLAIHLMEWTAFPADKSLPMRWWKNKNGGIGMLMCSWSPTRNINQALGDGGAGTVVGELKKKGWVLNSLYQDLNDPTWSCSFILVVNKRPKTDEYSEANTPTLTICLAALAALGIDLEEEKDD